MNNSDFDTNKFDEMLRMNESSFQQAYSQLTATERKQFELFQKIFKDVDYIKSSKIAERKFSDQLNVLSEKYFNPQTAPKSNPMRNWIILAISLLLLVILVLLVKVYASSQYSNENIYKNLEVPRAIAMRGESENPNLLGDEVSEEQLNLYLQKTEWTPSEAFSFIHYFAKQGDWQQVLEKNELLMNFGDLYLHEYYLNKINAFLHLNDRNQAKNLAKTAMSDKRIFNNYVFIEIYDKLNNSLGELFN